MTEEAVARLPFIGDKAPSFKAKTTQGEIDSPKYFEGKWVVFFSHPADSTPVGTKEFMAFATMQPEFEERNCKLLWASLSRASTCISRGCGQSRKRSSTRKERRDHLPSDRRPENGCRQGLRHAAAGREQYAGGTRGIHD